MPTIDNDANYRYSGVFIVNFGAIQCINLLLSQPVFICSMPAMKTPEQCVKSV